MTTSTRRKTIGIDMDNVIADMEQHCITWYERDFGVKVIPEDIFGLPEDQQFPDRAAVSDFFFTAEFFRSAPVMEGAVEALQRLSENFDIYIVSAAMEYPLSLYEKLQWLNEHFPFIHWKNIIFCGDKSVIHTDYLIDDYPKNLDYCPGKAIMFTAAHNRNHTQYTRVNNWKEAVEFMEKELEKAES